MTVGTRSVLFGAHAFWLHPFVVALAWWRLYGFPWDPRLWVAFFVHDLGYWGKPNMDGPEGEWHPALGARISGWLFDIRGWRGDRDIVARICNYLLGDPFRTERHTGRPCSWYQFCFYHSRYLAKLYDVQPSRLCIADKYAIILEPVWLYLPRVWLTGEYREYLVKASRMARHEASAGRERADLDSMRILSWCRGMRSYTRRWVEAHKDGRADTWTSVAVRGI